MKCGTKHKIESEICNEKGAYNKKSLSFCLDIDNAIDKVMKKHEGELSVDAMMCIIYQSAALRGCYAKAMSIIF